IQIVEKQPADTARFLAMLQIKILIAPGFELPVDIRAERIARLLRHTMPVLAILVETIVWGEVIAAAKPPDRRFARLFRQKETYIGMGRGHVGIAGMNDQRDSQGLPAASCQLGAQCGRGRRQLVAEYMGETDAAFFEYRSVRQNPGAAPSALRSLPEGFLEPRGSIL